MAYLRKRLSKAQRRMQIIGPASAAKRPTSSPITPERLASPGAALLQQGLHDDFEGTPPPPTFTPGESGITNASPSSEAINRYKLRAPGALGPATSSIAVTQENRPNTTEVEGIASQTYGLVEKMDDPAPQRNKRPSFLWRDTSGESSLQASSEDDSSVEWLARSTRSKERRQERADSAASAGTGSCDAVYAAEGQDIFAPAGLMIRKNNHTSSITSPSFATESTVQSGQADDSAVVHTSSLHFSHTFNGLVGVYQDSTSLPNKKSPCPENMPSSSSDDDDMSILPCPPFRPSHKDNNFGTVSSTLVFPPVYHPTRPVLYQWSSQLSSTSRPDGVWGWPKRWTCCKCAAETIVEQKTCAKLNCQHLRCGDGCKLMKTG